jgi:hypothetical protein
MSANFPFTGRAICFILMTLLKWKFLYHSYIESSFVCWVVGAGAWVTESFFPQILTHLTHMVDYFLGLASTIIEVTYPLSESNILLAY